MKILLLNDNPVARKLVALSAQYTKNDLTIIGSVGEIRHNDYDVVIVDDAYYSGESIAELEEKASHSVSILMAARGNSLSAGFDKVLSKPFLPADLITLLTTIEETLPTPPPVVEAVPLSADPLPPLKEVVSFSDPEPVVSSFDEPLPPLKEVVSFSDPEPVVSSFDEPLPPLKEESNSSFDFSPLQEEDEETFMSFEEFSAPQETQSKSSIFDHEAVQDVQNLLKTTDTEESDFSLGSFDLLGAEANEEPLPLLDDVGRTSLVDEKSYGQFDDMMMPEPKAEKSFFDAPLIEDTKSTFGSFNDDYLPLLEEEKDIFGMNESNDSFIVSEPVVFSPPKAEPSHSHEEEMKTAFYSDESSILPLHAHANEQKTAFYSDEMGSELFDGIAEREMKLAMGEPVEEATYDIPVVMTQSNGNISSEGMEALQVLLKALSNEETASSLKGLNISININLNLGNGK